MIHFLDIFHTHTHTFTYNDIKFKFSNTHFRIEIVEKEKKSSFLMQISYRCGDLLDGNSIFKKEKTEKYLVFLKNFRNSQGTKETG